MCRIWSLERIKQHKILFWNQSTYCAGFLGFVFVQLCYNQESHSVEKGRWLFFHCTLILRHSQRATIILMEIGYHWEPAWDFSFFPISEVCCQCSVWCSEQCRPKKKVRTRSVVSFLFVWKDESNKRDLDFNLLGVVLWLNSLFNSKWYILLSVIFFCTMYSLK